MLFEGTFKNERRLGKTKNQSSKSEYFYICMIAVLDPVKTKCVSIVLPDSDLEEGLLNIPTE